MARTQNVEAVKAKLKKVEEQYKSTKEQLKVVKADLQVQVRAMKNMLKEMKTELKAQQVQAKAELKGAVEAAFDEGYDAGFATAEKAAQDFDKFMAKAEAEFERSYAKGAKPVVASTDKPKRAVNKRKPKAKKVNKVSKVKKAKEAPVADEMWAEEPVVEAPAVVVTESHEHEAHEEAELALA